jgi:hypothetical protein
MPGLPAVGRIARDGRKAFLPLKRSARSTRLHLAGFPDQATCGGYQLGGSLDFRQEGVRLARREQVAQHLTPPSAGEQVVGP